MTYTIVKKMGIAAAAFSLVMAYTTYNSTLVLADPPAKIVWCHCEPNGNCQTLELPQAALENAGHVNASGNPLHAGDHAGQCVEPTPTTTPIPSPTATPIPTVTPSPTPSVSPSPTPIDECDEEVCEPTPTPIMDETITPTPTTNPGNQGGPGDGKSDGRSDGKSSCPECTKAPAIGGGDVLGVSTESEGQVLGASTDFAGTGTAADMLMNIIGSTGLLSVLSGMTMLKKKKSA